MQRKKNNKIYISAGEASGDLLGADLARALLQKNPMLQLVGMGSKKMRDAGVHIQFDSARLSVVGFIEVITHLLKILRTLHAIKKYLAQEKPDCMILIDFPDTHFRLLKTAKKLGIPVVYYVSPQIWAWRFSRIKQIKKYVAHMAVLFAFEEKIYRDAGVPVTWVGHPLLQLAKPSMTKSEAYLSFGLDTEKPVVTLFPGSRESEMKNHLAVMLQASNKIFNQNPRVQFTLMLAPHFDENKIRPLLPTHIKIIQNNIYDLLQITSAAIAVSGTVTLEIALMQVPFCIIYKMNPITFWLAKKLITVKYIGLCNIAANKLIAKEFIQDQATPDHIAAEITRCLTDQQYIQQIKNNCADIRNAISTRDKSSTEPVAEIILHGLRTHLFTHDATF